MWFRRRHELTGVFLDTSELPVSFTVTARSGRVVTVTFVSAQRFAPSEQDDPGSERTRPACEVSTQFEPSAKIAAGFERMAAGETPEGSQLPHRSTSEMPSYRFTPTGTAVPDLYALPQGMQDLIRQVRAELDAATTQVVGLVRWRIGDEGPHQPLTFRNSDWSLDGESWHPLPTHITARSSVKRWPRLSDLIAADVQRYLDEGVVEPLAHALWREAWESRGTNPRSSLLIGMTALEVGVKHHIGAVVPETQWLFEEIPAPPVHRMLVEYIPRLHKLGAGAAIVNKEQLEVIKKGVQLRNKVAHAGRTSVPHEQLEDALHTVRAVLRRLDRLRGHAWFPPEE